VGVKGWVGIVYVWHELHFLLLDLPLPTCTGEITDRFHSGYNLETFVNLFPSRKEENEQIHGTLKKERVESYKTSNATLFCLGLPSSLQLQV